MQFEPGASEADAQIDLRIQPHRAGRQDDHEDRNGCKQQEEHALHRDPAPIIREISPLEENPGEIFGRSLHRIGHSLSPSMVISMSPFTSVRNTGRGSRRPSVSGDGRP